MGAPCVGRSMSGIHDLPSSSLGKTVAVPSRWSSNATIGSEPEDDDNGVFVSQTSAQAIARELPCCSLVLCDEA